MKLIAILRDPVDRALSHYHHECRTYDAARRRFDSPCRRYPQASGKRVAGCRTRSNGRSRCREPGC